MLTIGLTGGIGSGKTTVANYFQSLGIPVIDADKIARELTEPHQFAHFEIVKHFDKQILTQDGQINRAKLRKIILNNPQEKNYLESLLHPLIRERIAIEVKTLASAYCIIEIPLLTETERLPFIDRILVIDCNEATQMSRTLLRVHINEQEVKQIIERQSKRAFRLSMADDVLVNEGTLDDLQQQVNELHEMYLGMSASKPTGQK